LTVISSLTPQLRSVVRQVDVGSPDSIELELIDGRVIVWGDADQSAKKAQIATLLLGRAHQRLDVSAPGPGGASWTTRRAVPATGSKDRAPGCLDRTVATHTVRTSLAS